MDSTVHKTEYRSKRNPTGKPPWAWQQPKHQAPTISSIDKSSSRNRHRVLSRTHWLAIKVHSYCPCHHEPMFCMYADASSKLCKVWCLIVSIPDICPLYLSSAKVAKMIPVRFTKVHTELRIHLSDPGHSWPSCCLHLQVFYQEYIWPSTPKYHTYIYIYIHTPTHAK